jgi:hypothetical protein
MIPNPRIAKIVLAVLLAVCIIVPSGSVSAADKDSDNKNDDDVRFTFYVAFGGAACAGLFWYLAYSSGLVSNDFLQKPALINYNEQEGWSMGPPMPRLNTMTNQGDTYLEFIRIQF